MCLLDDYKSRLVDHKDEEGGSGQGAAEWEEFAPTLPPHNQAGATECPGSWGGGGLQLEEHSARADKTSAGHHGSTRSKGEGKASTGLKDNQRWGQNLENLENREEMKKRNYWSQGPGAGGQGPGVRN